MKKIKIRINKKHQEFNVACANENFEKIKAMVEAGLDLTEMWAVEEWTPLNIALRHETTEVLTYLLDNGLPLYFNDIDTFKMYGAEGMKKTFLFGHWDIDWYEAIMLMLDYATEVNSPYSNHNGLINISKIADGEEDERTDAYLQTLLDKGADVDYPMKNRPSVLHAIVYGKNAKYVELLIRRSNNIDAVSKDDNLTPLYEAISCSGETAVRTLVELGADVNRVFDGFDSKSILDVAIGYQRRNNVDAGKRIVDFLQTHGAKTYQQLLDDGDISA